MKKLLTAIFVFSITVPAFARTVTGTVLDENNEPMIGASIRVASDGSCTDAQIAAIPHAKSGELKKGKCHVTECDLC